MYFKSKEEQEVLEVLVYNDGPLVIGFTQDDKDFISVLKETKENGNSSHIVFSLDKKDRRNFENFKNNPKENNSFLLKKPCFLLEYDYLGNLVSQKNYTSSKEEVSSLCQDE